MTPDELITEAYRRYPPGSVFKSSFTDGGRYRKVAPYSKNSPIKFVIQYSSTTIRAVPGMTDIAEDGSVVCSNPTVYENGVWAPGSEYDIVKGIMKKYE